MGFSSGVGALVAGTLRLSHSRKKLGLAHPLACLVFGYLRLPNLLSERASSSDPDTLARGLVVTFYLVATLSFLEGVFVFLALPGRSTLSTDTGVAGKGFKKVMRRLARRLTMGFVVASKNRDVSLALFTSFAVRSTTR